MKGQLHHPSIMLRRISQKIKTTLSWIENTPLPFSYFLLTFVFAITLRNFLEAYFTGEIQDANFSSTLFHYYIFYVFLAMTLVILCHYATRETVVKISRIILPSFLILILNPILSLAVPAWRSFSTGYAFPDTHHNLLYGFLTFFGPLYPSGASPAMRVEIGLALILIFIYFHIKKHLLLRSLLFTFLTYTVIYSYGCVPFMFDSFMRVFGLKAELLLPPMTNFYLLCFFPLGVWLFYLYDRKSFHEILKDARWTTLLRFLHYEMMFAFGIVLSEILYEKPMRLTSENLFPLIFSILAIFFACLYSLMTNNSADQDIDVVTNHQKPSVTKSIDPITYHAISWSVLGLAVLYSWAAGVIYLFLILLFIGNYFLYSMPPIRFKRVPFFSKILISLNCLVIILLGYYFHGGHFDVPLNVVGFFLLWVTAALNFIDLKDYEGDKKAGIKTLPVIFGLEKSKIIIGIFFLMAYGQTIWISKRIEFCLLMVGVGIVQYFLINRKNYNEKPVFIVYLLSMLALIIFIRRIYFPA